MYTDEFPNVRNIIFDPNDMTRRQTDRMLSAEGFSNTRTFSDLKTTFCACQDDVDLFLAVKKGSDTSVCTMVRHLRQHGTPKHRFMMAIALLTDPDPGSIPAIVNAGFDAALVLPMSLGTLQQRLKIALKPRRPFVVTSDYIGPDRRDAHRPGTQPIPLVDAPNPVQLMAEGKVNRDQYLEVATRVSRLLDEQYVTRYLGQVVWLCNNLIYAHGRLGEPEFDQKYPNLLSQLVCRARNAPKHLNTSRKSHLSDVIVQLSDVSERVSAAEERPAICDIEALGECAREIERVCGDEVAVAH